MGSKTITSRGVRAAFAALAAASVLSTSACAKQDLAVAQDAVSPITPTQLTLIRPAPQVAQAGPTPDDFKKLDEYHAAAIASLSKRSVERCAAPLDTTKEGPLGNRNIEKLVGLDEVTKNYPRMTTPTKALLVMADKGGYAICFDKRLSGSEYASALYINDKVIALNPTALNPEKPVLFQQAALSVSLQHLLNFWNKGVPEQVAMMPITIAIHAGTLRSDFNVTQWGAQNLSPAPVIDFKKPVDPNAEKRRWMNEASYRQPDRYALG